MLLEAGADINLQDMEGITALHWACSAGHLGAVQLLLELGAAPNLMEVDGERLTPLDYAIIGQHQDVAQLLIEQGALSISSIQELAAIMLQVSEVSLSGQNLLRVPYFFCSLPAVCAWLPCSQEGGCSAPEAGAPECSEC